MISKLLEKIKVSVKENAREKIKRKAKKKAKKLIRKVICMALLCFAAMMIYRYRRPIMTAILCKVLPVEKYPVLKRLIHS